MSGRDEAVGGRPATRIPTRSTVAPCPVGTPRVSSSLPHESLPSALWWADKHSRRLQADFRLSVVVFRQNHFIVRRRRGSMASRVDTMLWVLSALYAVVIVAALYALAVNNDSLFQIVAFLSIGLTGVAVWMAFLARHQGWIT